ncbi:hypothetical protein PG999_005901 [Apiospora kogelbergensis]|uniref:DUF4440 domain-containing protein n=1 Tax=Apiospora kogelbergensis TaxID=1337665 RepID=A0AAW0QQQ8_9PEZI
MAANGKEEEHVLRTVTGFLDSVSEQETPLAAARKHVLPSAYAVDWRAHCGELLQTPPNEYVAEMERRLDRMRGDGLRSFVQALTTAAGDLPAPQIWVDAGQGIAAVWAGFNMKSNGEEKYRGTGAFTLYYSPRQQQTEEESSAGSAGDWRVVAFVDARWDPEYFRPRPVADVQATEELLAAARAFTGLLESEQEESAAAALRDVVLPGCIMHRLDDESGLQSLPFQDLILVYGSSAKPVAQQRRRVDVLDGEGRVVAGMGFLWMHYTVTMTTSREANDVQTTTRGTATLTFLQRNEYWLVSGVQEAERLIC